MFIKNLYLILELISGKSGGLFPKKFCKSSQITQEYQILPDSAFTNLQCL